MKPKVLPLIEQCIETGARLGYNRAHKHVENPEEHAILDRINDAVMSAITDYFTFEDHDFI